MIRKEWPSRGRAFSGVRKRPYIRTRLPERSVDIFANELREICSREVECISHHCMSEMGRVFDRTKIVNMNRIQGVAALLTCRRWIAQSASYRALPPIVVTEYNHDHLCTWYASRMSSVIGGTVTRGPLAGIPGLRSYLNGHSSLLPCVQLEPDSKCREIALQHVVGQAHDEIFWC